MYVTISIILVGLFILGVIVDYVTTVRDRNLKNKQQKIAKLQMILAKAQRLLNGRTLLPLTVISSIVCLKRAQAALKALISISATNKRRFALDEVNKKLAGFNELAQTLPYFYASLELPAQIDDQARMLKQCMLLVIVLKVEHAKGQISVENLNSETEQLDILIFRLKSAVYTSQAVTKLEGKSYAKAQSLSDKALELLSEISCDNEDVKALINEEIEKINLMKLGITGVIDEKNHDFYDKFKGKTDNSKTLANELDDGLDGVFGDKRKY
jgi:hypothetical protein